MTNVFVVDSTIALEIGIATNLGVQSVSIGYYYGGRELPEATGSNPR